MKNLITALLVLLITNLCFSQYSWEVKIENFKQINETTIEWEIWMKKGDGSLDFAYYGGQFTFQFDNDLMNGGKFVTEYFSIIGGEEMNQHSGFYKDEDAVIAGTPPNMFFNWLSSAPPNTGQSQTIISDTWIKFATFQAQLRKGDGNGNPHSFSDVDPKFAFHVTQSQIVSRDNVTQSTYSGVNVNIPTETSSGFTPARGVSANDRELAGYWFTGEGAWSETARWNNVTTENSNQVPPLATNNAGIAGQATLTDARTVNQLTIAEEALLVLSGDAGNIGHLTVNGNLFNDNQTDGAKKETVTIAEWDFEDTGQTGLPYLADDGIPGNSGVSEFTTTSTFDNFYPFDDHGVTGWTRAPFGYTWATGPGGNNKRQWQILISTNGYQGIKLSSKQWSDLNDDWFSGIGPDEFKLQYSLDGSSWTDIGSPYAVGNDGTTGNLTDVALPSAINDQSSVYIRWINTTTGKNGYSGIEDILITGEEIPPPPTGILVQSTATGTGSLIHNTADVEATIERYIPETGYHLVSVPFTQASNPRSGWFIWSYLFEFGVATQTWVSLGSSVWTTLEVDKGYMVYKYPGPDKWSSDTTYAMTGLMNNGAFPMKVEFVGDEDYKFNLVPNPYPSAIDWDEAGGWTKENLSGSYWIWKHELDQYATWNNGLSVPEDAATKDIPVGQSFFVLADNENPILTVNNGARVHSDQAFHKNQGELSDLLRLKAITADGADELAIHFMDYATPEYDLKHDAPKMPRGADIPQLYSYSADGRKLTINRLPMTDETISVTVGFDRSAAGEVTLEFNSLDSFDPDVTMFLWDMLTDTKVNLREKQQYSFMHHPDNNSARFALLFNSAVNVDEIEQTNIQMYAVNNNLNISIPDEMQERFDLTIYNTSGQVVFSQRVHTGHSVIAVPALGQGVYIARLVSGSQSMVKKLFLK